ncbi:MAG: Ni/Fe-hydrogenase, b-type cytochrome subunit [Pseudomonadota bacterium]|nr:Ni/Fe-hydrogenase, b-type cytochrome subunit [Pseudomonadales bacterium]MDY6920762.1 Ni/Fe-hydrogenase, b-type cytochrome subunit [Pseudomonadota bacterium]
MDSHKPEYTVKPSVYVYEAPVRIWHWVNALAITVLCITGYFIASPLPSMPGEASDHFLMGYIRFAHFASGYILALGFLFRVYWAFAGNEHARQLFLPPVTDKKWWAGVLHEAKWYAFMVREPHKYIGHNPLALLFMHVMLVWATVFMIFTGFALYGEGTGMGSWQYEWFSSWMIPLFGQSQAIHTWHHLVMWVIICFTIMHVYVAIREDIMSRQSMVSTMISGWRTFKDNRAVEDKH